MNQLSKIFFGKWRGNTTIGVLLLCAENDSSNSDGVLPSRENATMLKISTRRETT